MGDESTREVKSDLPAICVICKRIRIRIRGQGNATLEFWVGEDDDPKSYAEFKELYEKRRISHGRCPDCMEAYLEELQEYLGGRK